MAHPEFSFKYNILCCFLQLQIGMQLVSFHDLQNSSLRHKACNLIAISKIIEILSEFFDFYKFNVDIVKSMEGEQKHS